MLCVRNIVRIFPYFSCNVTGCDEASSVEYLK
uniref:Uncharacterized protein n=1 Tax=Anguilla anguilla TaxID=7936 RepID=A0A0E9U334_ANGAN